VKTKLVWFVAAFVMAPLPPLCFGQAYQPGNNSRYNPGNVQTYTYTVTSSDQPQYNGTPQYGAGTYTAVPTSRQQAPVVQRPIQPQVAYQQSVPQAQANQPLRPASKAVAKKKAVRSAHTVNANRLIAARPVNQRRQVTAARPYQSNYTVQPRPVYQQRYYQQPQTGYYTNPYQTQYSAAPNYYQGYYNSWGSSSRQACAPGRA
jgi:hypothetical protein